jgi:hypothetical protein
MKLASFYYSVCVFQADSFSTLKSEITRTNADK